jgi:hypothetical protein
MASEHSPGSEAGQGATAGQAGTPGDPAAAGINQGATGGRPLGESPASVRTENGGDAFDERPEAFVGAAFAGGFALAMILKRVAR